MGFWIFLNLFFSFTIAELCLFSHCQYTLISTSSTINLQSLQIYYLCAFFCNHKATFAVNEVLSESKLIFVIGIFESEKTVQNRSGFNWFTCEL